MMKRSKLWSRRDVPEDLWPEILSRLPVKTLLRFRCVSKQWRDLIDDPDFARSHLLLFNNNRSETHFFDWLEERIQKNILQVRCIKSLNVTSRLHVPQSIYDSRQKSGDSWFALSSIDGLFMLARDRGVGPADLMLWNPATRKTLTLPPSPEISVPVGRFHYQELGLGFDPSVKDYKYVRLSHVINLGLHSIAVYSLATNSWKITRRCYEGTLQRLRHLEYIAAGGICLKGFLFCLALVGGLVQELILFDVRSDTLGSISLPVQVLQDGDDLPKGLYDPGLTVADDGCSVAMVFCHKGSGSVWVLQGLGVDGIKSCSWSKRYTFLPRIPDLDEHTGGGYFFCLKKNGELLIDWNSTIISYNLHTNEEKVVGKRKHGFRPLPYVESLLHIPQ